MGFLPKLTPGNTSIGLDVGSSAIKLVQLQGGKNGIALYKAGSAPTPQEAVKGGVVVDPLAVAKAIGSLLEALQVEGTAVAAGIAGPTVVVREVPLPVMSDRQLRKSIQWEARNYISFPVEDSVVEFEVLERPPTSSGGQMRVMLVAAPRDMVDSQVEAIELAGLEPVAVEIQPFASLRGILAANGHTESGEGDTTAALGIGAAYTDITIVKDGQFVLTRTIPIAGDAFTDAIKSALDIDTPEANQLKETAMQVVSNEEERATLDPAAQQASRAIEPLLDELIREVRRSLAYHDYQQQSPDAEAGELGVNRILLSGGGAKLPRIGEYFQAQLGVPVEVASVFGQSGLGARGVNQEYLKSHAPILLVGTGLALRGLLRKQQRAQAREGSR
ncbi:MAG: type IV pilus assembly protein PilM [Armatimonadota bacterium]|nr:MAG: type IV pilus assembly protein PilM [Armatimonadota bacterium]